MHARYLGALFALALSACSVFPPRPTDNEIRQVTLINATVRVEIEGGGLGSGTVVSPKHVLTNHHVAGEKGTHTLRAWVKDRGKTYPVTFKAKVIAHDKDHDLALLELDGEWPGYVAPIAVDAKGLMGGDRVWVAGSPLGKHPHIVSGEVSLPLDDDEMQGVRHLIATASVAPGNSGGGLWWKNPRTGRYELVAVTRARAVVPLGFGAALLPHMSMFIPVHHVREFLAKAGVTV
jgi:S1-C subfamily serine protease